MAHKKFISWNVNGLRAVHKKGFLDWFAAANADIICIQETKAHPDQLSDDLLRIAGYDSFFASAEKKGYSGVAVWSKHKPEHVSIGLGIPRFDSEGRTIIADYGAYVLYNIYYPNGKASDERLQFKMDFYDAFLESAEKYRAAGKHVIACGDVNTAHTEIDLSHPKNNETVSGFLPQERAWIDRFLAAGYADSLRLFHKEPELYTWWDMKTRARERNIGWRLDYFFVDNGLVSLVKDAGILPDVYGSDHCPVYIDVDI